VFHQGTTPMRSAPLRYAHPLVMDDIALAFPELRVVMAHLGHPWQADTIAVIPAMVTPLEQELDITVHGVGIGRMRIRGSRRARVRSIIGR
jgi:hypothetical protein